jgi:hypothetical protein
VRIVERARSAEGSGFGRVRSILDDRDVDDVHVVVALAEAEALPALEAAIGALLATARLVPAVKAEAPVAAD